MLAELARQLSTQPGVGPHAVAAINHQLALNQQALLQPAVGFTAPAAGPQAQEAPPTPQLGPRQPAQLSAMPEMIDLDSEQGEDYEAMQAEDATDLDDPPAQPAHQR
eukprot:2106380-Lingulodinium_polyedra.AAC.1